MSDVRIVDVVYGDWSDNPAKLRTDVFYLVEDAN
jgi:hypothetical protein